MSAISEKFRFYWEDVCKGVQLVPEHNFHPTRKWRFDFAIPQARIAFEVEGIKYTGKSRHTTVSGYSGDCEKYNEAMRLGWRPFRFTSQMIVMKEIEKYVAMVKCELKAKEALMEV